MIQIRPISDIRNKFPEIEVAVTNGQPVYLTKNGYGAMVVLSLQKYAELTGGQGFGESAELLGQDGADFSQSEDWASF